MSFDENGVYHFQIDGVPCSMIFEDEMYRRFNAGVPIEDVAEARGCSVNRAKELIKRQRLAYERQTMRNTIDDLVKFDKAMVKYDPSGSSALTMAYLQPMRKFLEQLN
jgi:hypothetical protein